MRRHLTPWFALLLALLLVSGQQAALAHILGHATNAAAVEVAQQDEEAGHGAALVLSQVCTNCIAFAAVDASPAAAAPVLALAAVLEAAPAIAVAPAPTFGSSPGFLSRAPPLL